MLPVLKLVAQRVALGLLLLLAVSAVIFLGVEALPGDAGIDLAWRYGRIVFDATPFERAVHELGQLAQVDTPFTNALLGLTRLQARERGLLP